MSARFPRAIAHALIVLGVFLLVPVAKPILWLLDEWGGFRLPFFIWPAVFLVTGFTLLRTERPRLLRRALFAAFLILTTVAAAAYLTQGWNSLTLITVVLAYHCGRANLDLKVYEQRWQA